MLAVICGYKYPWPEEIVDKLILLLNRGADTSIRNGAGDTLFHVILSTSRLYEKCCFKKAIRDGQPQNWIRSITDPVVILMLLITYGADIHATNNCGLTPTEVAYKYNRINEWFEALENCGFNVEQLPGEPNLHVNPDVIAGQTCQLSFDDCCKWWTEQQKFEEAELMSMWHTIRVQGDRRVVRRRRRTFVIECSNCIGMDPDNLSGNCAMEGGDEVDNATESGVGSSSSSGTVMDITDKFFDYDQYGNISLEEESAIWSI